MPLYLTDVLKNGYFPKELPPPFNTDSYAQTISTRPISSIITQFNSRQKYSMSCIHNLVRAGGLRRNLSIPNPKHFLLLANHIVNNWNNLTTECHKSPFSLTKPMSSFPERAITPQYTLSERVSKIAELRSTSRFILKADISRFYPSIYTHSIPWALFGKIQAKSLHMNSNLNGTWQDKLDTYSRIINNNQTIGIPIGPDTSILIAEVILSHIDCELANRVKNLKGIRYIDDYEFAFANRSDAEKVLGYLQHQLNEFELALNPNKTRIIELPEKFDPLWTSKIRTFIFRNAGETGQKNDLSAYFDMVFDFFKQNPEEGLLKYAIGRLKSENICEANWKFLEDILSHCILFEPACIPQVCEQITYYKSLQYAINKNLWKNALNRIIVDRVPLGQSSEAAWAMWVCKILSIKLSVQSTKVIGNSEDSIIALMGLGLASKGLANISYLSGLNRFHNSSELFNNQWLLCYEGNIKNWFGTNSNVSNLKRDSAFEFLINHNVTFFDIDVPVPSPINYTQVGTFSSSSGY